jgi:NAD(P)-dependent dehydrogenase (short-subunit alcohol dehydrogenase family)
MSRVTVDLHDKVAFLTGAGSGIGRGLALQMARDGAAVAVADLDGDAAAAVAAEITQAGGRAISFPVDVRSPEQIESAVASAQKAFGCIDFLFANAGALGPAEYLKITPDDWDLLLDVNVKGVALTCRAVVPQMMERRQGRILITASYNGVRAGAHVIPYRVSKAAVLMYTRCLALVMAPYGVTVNALCPGVTLTPMQLSYAASAAAQQGVTVDAYLASRADQVPMHEFTDIDDVTGLAEFIVSDSARLITGQAIAPDGGVMISS